MNGGEDNEDNVESSEISEVQLGLCIREACSEPWKSNTISHFPIEKCKASMHRLERQCKVAAN